LLVVVVQEEQEIQEPEGQAEVIHNLPLFFLVEVVAVEYTTQKAVQPRR
jgi:hypothetical protein